MLSYFVGIDVQIVRACSFAVLDAAGDTIDAGWLETGTADKTVESLLNRLARLFSVREDVAVGVDAPRCPLPHPRQWFWRGSQWMPAPPSSYGRGRHCEVVIAAHRLANPQWTPYAPPFPEWMQLGFELFKQLEKQFVVHEVFPTASYRMFAAGSSPRIRIQLGYFSPHPKDMLDAYVAAATVREFVQGRGTQVGGGDGLGTIVLPRPLRRPIAGVLKWPKGRAAAMGANQSTHRA